MKVLTSCLNKTPCQSWFLEDVKARVRKAALTTLGAMLVLGSFIVPRDRWLPIDATHSDSSSSWFCSSGWYGAAHRYNDCGG